VCFCPAPVSFPDTCSQDNRDKTEFRRSFHKEFRGLTAPLFSVDLSAFNPDVIVTGSADNTAVLTDAVAHSRDGKDEKMKRFKGHSKPIFNAQFISLRNEEAKREAREKRHIEFGVVTASADGTACLYSCTSDVSFTFDRICNLCASSPLHMAPPPSPPTHQQHLGAQAV